MAMVTAFELGTAFETNAVTVALPALAGARKMNLATPLTVFAEFRTPLVLTTLPTPLVTAVTAVPSGTGRPPSSLTVTRMFTLPFGATAVADAEMSSVPTWAADRALAHTNVSGADVTVVVVPLRVVEALIVTVADPT